MNERRKARIIKECFVIENHNDNITCKKFYEKNNLFLEMWFKDGKLNSRSNENPAVVEYFLEKENRFYSREYFFNFVSVKGELNEIRYGKPNFIDVSKNKEIVDELNACNKILIPCKEFYYTDNVVNRNGGKPAVISYTFDSNYGHKIRDKMWVVNGKIHREDDEPALVKYHKNGSLDIEIWFQNDEIHRENDAPAVRKYHYNSVNVEEERWFLNGNLFRKNNLNTVIYNEHGIVFKQYNEIKQFHPSFHSEINRYFLPKMFYSKDLIQPSFVKPNSVSEIEFYKINNETQTNSALLDSKSDKVIEIRNEYEDDDGLIIIKY